MNFQPVPTKPDFNSLEQEIIKFWKDNDIFTKSKEQRKDAKKFIFYEGPPTANGKPGIHHVLARTFKDLVCRYQTMNGKYVERNAGWDEHGLPVEIEVEKQLGFSNDKSKKEQIESLGVAEFNKLCASSTQKYIKDWEALTERMGYWLDISSAYRTSDPNYIESVWKVLKELNKQNLLYKGFKIVPWACDSGTVVSQAEVALGYKDVTEDSLYVKFQLTSESVKKLFYSFQVEYTPSASVSLIAWTTTPWTLPSNMALAVSSKFDYVLCQSKETATNYFIISKNRWDKVLDHDLWHVIKEITLNASSDLQYINLFNPVESNEVVVPQNDFIQDSITTGTGIVHIAPAFGQDDFECFNSLNTKKNLLCTINPDGVFNRQAPEFLIGQSIFNENKKTKQLEFTRINKIITKHLEGLNAIYKVEPYSHSYPHNWRTKNPLIYYLRPSWYIATTKIKEKLISVNQKINWIPAHVKDGRFGDWLNNNIDWSISRERFWGTPLPIWENNKGNYQVIGSYQELKDKVPSLDIAELNPHKPQIDTISWIDSRGDEWKRVPEVLDCWVDSGSLIAFKESADFICEGIDQTRGWFYSLLVLYLGVKSLEDLPPYKNVMCLGHILDKEGHKMGKSKGNAVDPWHLFNKFGVDPVRWYMVSSASCGNSICFDENQILEITRRFFLPLWNTYAFFVLYANLDKVTIEEISNCKKGERFFGDRSDVDLWLWDRTLETEIQIASAMEKFEFGKVTNLIEAFVDDLSNIWVRANRHRFWNTSGTKDIYAYSSLYNALLSVCQWCAPIIPMLSETIYQNLKGKSTPQSIHLTSFNLETEGIREESLNRIEEMKLVQRIIKEGRNKRQELKIKIRQPLSQVILPQNTKVNQFKDLILKELNVKEIVNSDINELQFNTNLTEDLRAEGISRELIHAIQQLRKESSLNVSDRIKLCINYNNQEELIKLIHRKKESIAKEVLALDWEETDFKLCQMKQIKIEGKKVEIGVSVYHENQ